MNQGQLNEKAHRENQHTSPYSRVALGETDGPYSRPMTIFHHLSQNVAPSHWAVTFPNKEQTKKSHKSTASALHLWLNTLKQNDEGQQQQRLLPPYSNFYLWERRWDLPHVSTKGGLLARRRVQSRFGVWCIREAIHDVHRKPGSELIAKLSSHVSTPLP